MAQKLDDATKTGPVVFLDRNQKLHLPQLPAAPAANLQQKLAERLYCARSGNGHLRPGHRTAEPDRRWCRKPLKNIGPPLSAMAARPALRSVRSMQCEVGNFTIGIIAKRLVLRVIHTIHQAMTHHR
jgi:hypothetical protein